MREPHDEGSRAGSSCRADVRGAPDGPKAPRPPEAAATEPVTPNGAGGSQCGETDAHHPSAWPARHTAAQDMASLCTG